MESKSPTLGRAVAQAVSSQLPTMTALVRTRAGSCGICGRQSGSGAGFFRVLRFPFEIKFPMIPSNTQYFSSFPSLPLHVSMSSDHHQVFAASLMYALCLTSNVHRKRYICTGQHNTEETLIDILYIYIYTRVHAPCRIRTHGSSVHAVFVIKRSLWSST
jgi:hypothetical protein